MAGARSRFRLVGDPLYERALIVFREYRSKERDSNSTLVLFSACQNIAELELIRSRLNEALYTLMILGSLRSDQVETIRGVLRDTGFVEEGEDENFPRST